MSVFELPTVTLIPNGIHHPPIEDGRLLPNSVKEEIGVSPKKYLTNLKINKAKKLLTESDDPINLIAGSVGFADALSFSKFFRKELGLSPTEFRKDHN
ncbi:helix-turn-helix domain-containing protein [Enterococcus faecium]|nr:helix-turn-helix domain-containing protein [Enterococcus faecium]